MHDDFLSLRAWLQRGSDAEIESAPAIDPETETLEEAPLDDERAATLSQIGRFRASLADALEAIVAAALREVVIAVLGRELTVAPVEIRTIVTRVLATCADEDVLAVHVHPGDREALDDLGVPVVSDNALRRGDVTVTLRYGSIDATLGARLAEVLHAFGAA